MTTWVTQGVDSLDVRNGRDIANGNKPLFVERFDNENDFSATLHEGCIAGVAQEENYKYKDNDDDDRNTYGDPD